MGYYRNPEVLLAHFSPEFDNVGYFKLQVLLQLGFSLSHLASQSKVGGVCYFSRLLFSKQKVDSYLCFSVVVVLNTLISRVDMKGGVAGASAAGAAEEDSVGDAAVGRVSLLSSSHLNVFLLRL